MATSLSLVLKHLEPSQQTAIVDNIVSQLKNNSENEDQAAYVDTFCEILNINTSLKSSLGGFAYEYITDILRFENPEGHFDNILKLTLNIDTLATEIISFVVHNLKVFLATNPRHFNEKITSQVDFDLKAVEKNYDLQQTFIQNLLVFTEWYFIHNEEFAYKLDSSELDNLCYFYITNEILDISKYSSKVLKWRMPSICQSSKSVDFLWKMIFLLQQSGDKTEISYGYVLWLRFFNQFGPEVLKSNERFQLILSNEDYWYFLRDGLTSTTHEHKKFSLTLIQMSVQALSTNLSLPVISWDVTKEDQFIESWKRFCTLYEILGIDSAMNQAQAAANDLLKIFSPASDIPVPFALTILSVGFRASQDRIKKFALNLAFTLPKQSLSLFKYDFKFISHVFLPFTMKSNHFSVVKSNDSYSCEFGDKIDNFICNCVDSLDDPEEITNLVKLIFDVIGENRLTFGIARIYIVWGVLKGLEKKPFKPLNQSVLPSLCSLFETVAEGDIARTTLQTVHLRILLQVDASSVTLKAYVQSIVHFVQMNGYDIYRDNEEFFLDYFTSNFTKDDFLALLADENIPVGVEEFIVITSHLLSSGISPSKITPYLLSHLKCCEIIVQMAASRLNFKQIWSENLIVSRIERLINDMVVGSEELDISVYSDCDQLLKNVVLFSNEFWMSMRLGPLFAKLSKSLMEVDNIEEANYYIAQYKFFSLCFPQCVYNEDFDFSFTTITPLLHQNLKNIPKGSDPTFYKSKDGLTSYIVDNITALFKITTFDSQTKNLLLDLANDVVSMSAYNSHLSNVRLLASLLDSLDEKNKITSDEAKSIVGTLELLWGDIIADRLVLNQRNLHQSFIKLVLHPKLLICSIDDEELGDSLFKMLDDIVTNSSGRKGLLPCLFKHVSMYQVYYNESFERTLWLAKLLVKGTFLFQSELNIFQLDCIISENFDKHLNISGESVYTQSYGEPEVSYHVSIFAVAGSVKTEKFATEIWNYILENESIFRLRKPKKRTDREEQWKRIQLLSLMVSVVELVEESRLLAYMKDMLLPRLFNEASPLCRTYIEWLLCLTIQRIPHFKDDVFEALKEGIEAQQPLVMCVFERISMLISMQLDKEAETEFLTKFVVDVVLPTSSSNRALNRHFSSSMACVIYHEIIKKDLPFPPLLKETLSKINDMSVKSEGHGNYKTGDALLWDINKDCNLVSITGGLLLKVTDREIDAVYEKSYNSFLDDKQKSILRLPIGRDESSLWVTKERSSDIRSEDYYAPKSVQEEESSLLQTKSGVWSTVMELDENVRAAAQVRRSPLIVVSSLVDKPPNLGGICRLCDCLGAGWMTVDDISVKEDPEFKTVAVTADRWMPLIEVKIHEIIEFMRLKKKEGYTLIGLEQTDKSVELNSDLKFPEKSLILIGKEREGIPGDLLAELDMCVIIKQVGIVRSMNIQTATAVIVHAYSSQHC